MGLPIYSLVSDMAFASKIVKAAQAHHMAVRNFDNAERLLVCARQQCPCLAILDWDMREAEAFKVLKAFASDAVFKGVAVVGCVSQSKIAMKEIGERAGCLRVYSRTEFFRSLNDLIVRYAR